jgi:hypothetical protein
MLAKFRPTLPHGQRSASKQPLCRKMRRLEALTMPSSKAAQVLRAEAERLACLPEDQIQAELTAQAEQLQRLRERDAAMPHWEEADFRSYGRWAGTSSVSSTRPWIHDPSPAVPFFPAVDMRPSPGLSSCDCS